MKVQAEITKRLHGQVQRTAKKAGISLEKFIQEAIDSRVRLYRNFPFVYEMKPLDRKKT